jgi:hypothetical protein
MKYDMFRTVLFASSSDIKQDSVVIIDGLTKVCDYTSFYFLSLIKNRIELSPSRMACLLGYRTQEFNYGALSIWSVVRT